MITNGKIVGVGVQNEDYHKQVVPRGDKAYVMSRSLLCDFERCPRKWLKGFKSKDTDATEWGTLLDCMLLDAENFENRFHIIPATYPAPKTHKRVKSGEIEEGDPLKWTGSANYCKEWMEDRDDGKLFADEDIVAGCKLAIARLMDDPDIKEVLEKSLKQVMITAEWHDPETGIVVPIRTLDDIVPDEGIAVDDAIIDLKSTRNASPDNWERDVEKYGIDTQSGLYLDVWNSIPGVKPREMFRHIISENVDPYEPTKRWMSVESLNFGRDNYKGALALYCRCLYANIWPSFKEKLEIRGWGCTEPTRFRMLQMQRNQ